MEVSDIKQKNHVGLSKKTKSVLFIDDSPLVLETVKQLLRNSPYELQAKTDSFEGLCELIRNKLSAIFIDINMSGLNAYQFCALLKAQKGQLEYQYIRLVIVLEYANKLEQAKAYAAGANAVLVKPFGKNELFEAMKFPGVKAA